MCIPNALMLELLKYGYNVILDAFRTHNNETSKVDKKHEYIEISHDEISSSLDNTSDKVNYNDSSISDDILDIACNDDDNIYKGQDLTQV